MILVDYEIEDLINGGDLEIDPFERDNIQPASVDLRLGAGVYDAVSDNFIYDDTVEFRPFDFYLGTTMERIRIPDTAATFIKGRSTVGRMGVLPVTAGFGDPGFGGDITLEMINLSPQSLELEVGDRVCQMVLAECNKPRQNYEEKGGKYQGQSGTTLPVEGNL